MNIRVALLTAAAAAALVSASASAQQQGPYIGAGLGATWLDEADVKGTPAGKIDFDTGYAGLLKGGYAYGNGWRAEGEFGYRNFDADSAGVSGELRAYNVFVNALYDFMPTGSWSPYLGAGAGMVRYVSDGVSALGVTSNDQDNTWGVQGIAGAWFALTDNWLLSADYRYMYTGDAKLNTSGAAQIEPDNSIHTVMLGVTYRFGAPAKPAPAPTPVAAPAPAPAPAPVAAPAPAPRAPETYIVFFAFDKSDISPVAAQVLDRAVADFRATGSTNVRIEGNADRSGSNTYNQRLSQRRAESVAAYLRSKGIGQGAIQTVANGEDKPRVPTADGVRNDENRNAQIFLRK